MQQLKCIRYWIYCFFFAALATLIFPMPYGPIMGVIVAQILYDDRD